VSIKGGHGQRGLHGGLGCACSKTQTRALETSRNKQVKVQLNPIRSRFKNGNCFPEGKPQKWGNIVGVFDAQSGVRRGRANCFALVAAWWEQRARARASWARRLSLCGAGGRTKKEAMTQPGEGSSRAGQAGWLGGAEKGKVAGQTLFGRTRKNKARKFFEGRGAVVCSFGPGQELMGVLTVETGRRFTDQCSQPIGRPIPKAAGLSCLTDNG